MVVYIDIYFTEFIIYFIFYLVRFKLGSSGRVISRFLLDSFGFKMHAFFIFPGPPFFFLSLNYLHVKQSENFIFPTKSGALVGVSEIEFVTGILFVSFTSGTLVGVSGRSFIMSEIIFYPTAE